MVYVITMNNMPILCVENSNEMAVKLMFKIWLHHKNKRECTTSYWNRGKNPNNPEAHVVLTTYTWSFPSRITHEEKLEFRIEVHDSAEPSDTLIYDYYKSEN